MGEKIIDPEALQFISSKVASDGGSAHEVLMITSKAVSKCQGSYMMEDLAKELDNDHTPLVQISHVIQAMQEGPPTSLDALVRTLPPAAKVLFCAVMGLCEEKGGTIEVSIARLKKLCLDATNYSFMDVNTFVVETLLRMLDERGLVTIKRRHGRLISNRDEWTLAIASANVQHVFKRTFLKEPFFCNIKDYVRNNFLTC